MGGQVLLRVKSTLLRSFAVNRAKIWAVAGRSSKVMMFLRLKK